MTNDTDHPDAGFRRDIEAKLGEGMRLTRADGIRAFRRRGPGVAGTDGSRRTLGVPPPIGFTFVHGDESTCPQRCAFCNRVRRALDRRYPRCLRRRLGGVVDHAWRTAVLLWPPVPVHHGESTTDRVDRLLRLRDLQDDGGGFIAVAPLRVEHPDRHRGDGPAAEALRAFAVARLMIDNIDHVQSHWPSHGLDVAGLSLNFGACDLSGSLTRYRTTHDTDLVDGELAQEDVVELIQDAGFTPVRP